MIQMQYGDKVSAFGGKLVLSREFFNPTTKDYIHIEAHEIGNDQSPTQERGNGDFEVALWVPEGNDGGHGMDGNLHHVVKAMQEYTPPPGFQEMTIPEECYD